MASIGQNGLLYFKIQRIKPTQVPLLMDEERHIAKEGVAWIDWETILEPAKFYFLRAVCVARHDERVTLADSASFRVHPNPLSTREN